MKGDNYSNQNIYNTGFGANLAVSQDKTVKVKVEDVSKVVKFNWVKNNNGWIKEHTGEGSGLVVRYNKAFNYWCTEDGRVLKYDGKEWWLMHPWKQGVSAINGYARENERYYYMLENNHPDFHQKIFVHHIVVWCWIPNNNGYYRKGKTIVDHIDGDSLNNEGSNLQYLTKEENIAKYTRGEG